MGKLKVNILGSSFSISAKETDEYLAKLHDYYKEITETLRTASEIKDPLKVSILSGVTLVDELYKEKQKNAELRKMLDTDDGDQAEQITLDLIDKIEKVL